MFPSSSPHVVITARSPLRSAWKQRVARVPPRGITIVELMITVAIVAILAAIALPAYGRYQENVRVLKAVNDIGAISSEVTRFGLVNRTLPGSLAEAGVGALLDPWGNAYQYVNHEEPRTRGQWRKDKNIVPINTDFDVFSMGKDGQSVPPLTARASRDDIVRANNGRFIGVASEYDP